MRPSFTLPPRPTRTPEAPQETAPEPPPQPEAVPAIDPDLFADPDFPARREHGRRMQEEIIRLMGANMEIGARNAAAARELLKAQGRWPPRHGRR